MPKINIKTDFADGEILYGEQLNQVTAPVELAMNTHDDEIEALQLDIDNLVLTDNNYTNAEKIKLEGIATGAEVNVQSDWNQTINTADDYIKNKPTIPETNQFALKTNVLELDNSTEFVPDADYEPATKKYVDDHSSTYTLPIASETTLGGIKIGDNLTVTEDGTLNAEEQGGTYELPIAGETTLGGIKIGDNLSIEIDGTLNASGGIETETDPVFTAWDKDYDDLTNKPTIPTQYTDELAQDAVGGMVDSTLTYTDGTPELKVTNPVTPQTTGFTITAGTTPKTLTVGLDASVSGTNTGDQDLSGYLTSETDPVFTAWDKDYDDLTNKPTIPTKTSDLTNDSNFVEDANYVHTDNNFTTTLKNKLGGIANGAEVNVNADWNATTGDAQILNKPTIPTRDSLGLDTDDTVTFANLSGTNTGDLDSTFEVSTFAELKAALENTANIVKHIFIANGNLTISSDTVINPWRKNYIYGDFRLDGDDLYSLTINYDGPESATIYIMNTLTVRDVPNIIINDVGISGTNSVYVNNLISETNNLNITGFENGVLYYVTKSGTITSTKMLQSNWLTNPVSNLTKATGSDINTGTDDDKYTTSKAITDSNVAFTSDIPVKAIGTEIVAGTDDAKYATAKSLKDAMMVSGDTLPIGGMIPWTSNTIPDNWLLCDGQAVSRTTYASLFAVVSTTYGAGDGTTTFNVPNIKGRTIVGRDSADTDFDVLGETRGAKTHQLTVNEIPSHSHTPVGRTAGGGTESIVPVGGTGDFRNISVSNTTSTGGGLAHNNLQPSIVENYIIKAQQSSGVVATVVDNLTSTSTTNALSANMGRELNTRHIMTGELTSTLSITGTSATKIPLASYNSTGTKLSIASDGIKIGAGVNKVLVSAQAAHATLAAAGLKQLRVYKNQTQTATTRTQIATANSTINISQYLLDVAENDIIYLYYVGVNGDTVGIGVNYDTWLTVERVA